MKQYKKYTVSETGNIYNRFGKKLKTYKNKGQSKLYLRVDLCDKGKVEKWYVHRLVAMLYLGDISGMDIDHIDNNSFNNEASNLQIVTARLNQRKKVLQYNYRSKNGWAHWLAK